MSFAADVYAFAVLAWVVCTREQPYKNLQSPETVMKEMLMQATPTPTPTPIPNPLGPAPTPTLCPILSPFLTLSLNPPPLKLFFPLTLTGRPSRAA